MKKRSQAALEFLTTYGWAFIVILTMVSTLSYFGVLSPTSFVGDRCVLGSPFVCDSNQFVVGEDGFRVAVRSALDENLVIEGLSYSVGDDFRDCRDFEIVEVLGSSDILIECVFQEQDAMMAGSNANVQVSVRYRSARDSSGEFSRTTTGDIQSNVESVIVETIYNSLNELNVDYELPSNPTTLQWNGDYLIVGTYDDGGDPNLFLFRLEQGELVYTGFNLSLPGRVTSVSWMGADRLMVVHGNTFSDGGTTNRLFYYEFDETTGTLTQLTNPPTFTGMSGGSWVRGTGDFSSSTQYFLAGTYHGHRLYLYSRSGDSFTRFSGPFPTSAPSHSLSINHIAWLDDEYIAVARRGAEIYRRDGNTLVNLSFVSNTISYVVYWVDNYLLIGSYSAPHFGIYEFNTTTEELTFLSQQPDKFPHQWNRPSAMDLHHKDYLLVAYAAWGPPGFAMYRFNREDGSTEQVMLEEIDGVINDLQWNGDYVAVASQAHNLQLFEIAQS